MGNREVKCFFSNYKVKSLDFRNEIKRRKIIQKKSSLDLLMTSINSWQIPLRDFKGGFLSTMLKSKIKCTKYCYDLGQGFNTYRYSYEQKKQ